MNSFKAEAMGLMAIVTILHLMDQSCGASKNSIQVYCDNESIIQKIQTPIEKVIKHSLADDVDIVLEIRSQLQKIKREKCVNET